MKTIIDKFFILIAIMFGIILCTAKSNLPAPNPNGKMNVPPPPQGVPIDDSLFVVFVLGSIYGVCLIYNYQIRQKTPV